MFRQLDAAVVQHVLKYVFRHEAIAFGERLLLFQATEDVLPLVSKLLADELLLGNHRALEHVGYLREGLLTGRTDRTREARAHSLVLGFDRLLLDRIILPSVLRRGDLGKFAHFHHRVAIFLATYTGSHR